MSRTWEKLLKIFGPRFPMFVILVLLISGTVWGCTAIFGSNTFIEKTKGIFSMGPLIEDKNGHTNILFLGVAGDGEEGGNLSDSIMIASFNPDNPSVSFLSLPRDLFIPSAVGERKVNEIYAAAKYKYKKETKGLDIVKKAISDFTGIEIHYGAVINFKLFEEVVDSLDGVNIFVPEDIEDPFYPDDNYGYQTFIVRKGLQTFDGEMALKYARSRKTSSDYSRAQRQQNLLLAIREKAQKLSLLTDFDKLGSFFDIYERNLNTDLKITQLISLAKMAINIDYDNAVFAVLNDDPTTVGGFLYTPAKEFYGGQYVLLPRDSQDTKLFMDLVLIHPSILLENAQISIRNGSRINGKANETSSRLRRLGFHIMEVGNYDTDKAIFKTFIRELAKESAPRTINFLAETFGARIDEVENVGHDSQDLIDLELILGTN